MNNLWLSQQLPYDRYVIIINIKIIIFIELVKDPVSPSFPNSIQSEKLEKRCRLLSQDGGIKTKLESRAARDGLHRDQEHTRKKCWILFFITFIVQQYQ